VFYFDQGGSAAHLPIGKFKEKFIDETFNKHGLSSLMLVSKDKLTKTTVDLSFFLRYRSRYQTLASYFKAFEIFIHRS
jgi:hypothetical protein